MSLSNSDTRSATSTDYSTLVHTTKGETNIGIVFPYEKLLKKKKRELDAGKRTTWAISPVTRRPENPKAYNRRKAQKRMDDPGSVLSLLLGCV